MDLVLTITCIDPDGVSYKAEIECSGYGLCTDCRRISLVYRCDEYWPLMCKYCTVAWYETYVQSIQWRDFRPSALGLKRVTNRG